jgi:hypothetical protein
VADDLRANLDGEVLRTGSANFSTSGENAQDYIRADISKADWFDLHLKYD